MYHYLSFEKNSSHQGVALGVGVAVIYLVAV